MKDHPSKFEKIAQPVLRIKVVDRFRRDPAFANLVMLCAGSFGNLVFAVINGVSWQMDSSPWSGAMTAYFVTLVIMSSLVAAGAGSNGKLPWRLVTTMCGISLIALGITIGVIMYRCIVEGRNNALPEFAMIAVAAFTFYSATVAIIGASRTRKGDLRQQTLLRVSIAGTIGALLILEMQMLGTYSYRIEPQDVVLLEAISGGVGALLVLAMGCSLLDKLRNKNSRGTEGSMEPVENSMAKSDELVIGLEEKDLARKTPKETAELVEPEGQEPSDADTESALGA